MKEDLHNITHVFCAHAIISFLKVKCFELDLFILQMNSNEFLSKQSRAKPE